MKYIISESQIKNLIKNNLDADISVDMVTNKHELPNEFDFLGERVVNRYLNSFGPMYIITLNKKNIRSRQLFLSQYRSKIDGGWMIVDEADVSISEFELMKRLGIQVLGMDIGTLIDEYLEEEESINEQEDLESTDNMSKVIQSYLDMNLPNYYGIKRFWVDYDEQFDQYDINVFFDRQIAIDMGGGINMLIRNAINSISQEVGGMFNGVRFAFFQHFEN